MCFFRKLFINDRLFASNTSKMEKTMRELLHFHLSGSSRLYKVAPGHLSVANHREKFPVLTLEDLKLQTETHLKTKMTILKVEIII